MIDRKTVVAAWQAFLGRVPPEEALAGYIACDTPAALVDLLVGCEEFRTRVERGMANVLEAVSTFAAAASVENDIADYVVPTALSVGGDRPRRVLLIGACVFGEWQRALAAHDPQASVETILYFQGGNIAGQLVRPIEDYDCTLVQIALRAVLPEVELFRCDADDQEYAAALDRAADRLAYLLDDAIAAVAGRPVFVLNYVLPQQNGLGRLQPRYAPSNPAFFFEELNRRLGQMIARHANVHLLDIDQLAATMGRRHVQDDPFWAYSHGGLADDYDYHADGDRLEPYRPLSALYPIRVHAFIGAAWAEARAMLRTIEGAGMVKMVCVDLDDTLWRGVAAEADTLDQDRIEGWPLGLVEALHMLRRRGVILAVTSKNEEQRIAPIMADLFGGRLSLDDFAIRKINWRPKADNIRDAIAEANVLPDSVVFIDDNPAERSAVAAAIPGLRVLGAPHLAWRRILLWSAETQVRTIGDEARRRNAMIAAQVTREAARGAQSHEDFLHGLGLSITLSRIETVDAAAFDRAFELINKTNQFNTTGRRWSHEEADGFFRDGGIWWVFEAADRFTRYGLVGVLVEQGDMLAQFVMSCRVFGLGADAAALEQVRRAAQQQGRRLRGQLVETDRNGPCRGIFAAGGWVPGDDGAYWLAPEDGIMPAHVAVAVPAARPLALVDR